MVNLILATKHDKCHPKMRAQFWSDHKKITVISTRFFHVVYGTVIKLQFVIPKLICWLAYGQLTITEMQISCALHDTLRCISIVPYGTTENDQTIKLVQTGYFLVYNNISIS